jgi:Ras GTPase-activating-like protein IQGAP2/3
LEEEYAACIGRLVYYRYINPAIMYVQNVYLLIHTNNGCRSTPETFDIVTNTVDVSSRKNLAQISRILTQITSGSEFGDDKPSYVPINDYVRKAIKQMSTWLLEGMIWPWTPMAQM